MRYKQYLLYLNASDEWTYLSQNGLLKKLEPQIPLGHQLTNFALSFFYEFDFWGKNRNLYKAALGERQVAIAETAQAKLVISSALATAFFSLKTALMQKELYEQLHHNREQLLALQERLLTHSITSLFDPLTGEESVLESAQWLEEIEQEIAVKEHLVNVLAGRGPETPLNLGGPLSAPRKELAIPCDLTTGLLARRPDLMAQIWQVESRARKVGAARAGYLPDVSISALLGLQSTSWSSFFSWASGTATALPALTMPLYTAGAVGAKVCAEKAQFYEAVYHYNEMVLESFQQVADLLAISKAVWNRRKMQEGVVASSTQRSSLMDLRARRGLDGQIEALQERDALLITQIGNIQLLFEQYAASIALYRALGGGYASCE